MLCLPFFISSFFWRTTSIHHTYDYWILRTQPQHDSQIGWRRHELELYFIHNWGFGKSGRRYRRFVANEMSNKFKSLTRYQYIIWPYRERNVTSTHSSYRSLPRVDEGFKLQLLLLPLLLPLGHGYTYCTYLYLQSWCYSSSSGTGCG